MKKLTILLALALSAQVALASAPPPAAAEPQDSATKLAAAEAELAAAKAMIKLQEAQLTEVIEMMQKQLPALQSHMNEMEKPLSIGENIGQLNVADGRVFENTIVTSIGASSITIRSERSAATITWQALPLLFRVRSAHAILAAANASTATGPQAPAASPAEPVGDSIYLGEIKIREIKTGGDYTYFAWTAVIGNPTERGVTENTRIFILDREKFQIGDATGEKQYIPPRSFRTLGGDGMLESNLWKQMDSYRVIIY